MASSDLCLTWEPIGGGARFILFVAVSEGGGHFVNLNHFLFY